MIPLKFILVLGHISSKLGKLEFLARHIRPQLQVRFGCLGNYVVSNCFGVAAGQSIGLGEIW